MRDRVTESDGARRTTWIIVLVLLTLCVVQIATYARAERFGADGSVYIVLAENLVAHGRYEFNHQPHTLYPPGFPAALALATSVGVPAGYAGYVRLMPLFAVAGLLTWFLVLARPLGTPIAAAATLLAASSPALYQLVTRSVVSDTLFFALSGVVFWVLGAVDRQRTRGRMLALGLGVLLAVPAAVSVRSAGLSLVVGLLAWGTVQLLRHGKRGHPAGHFIAIGASALGLALFIGWSAWSRQHAVPDYPGQHMASYTSQVLTLDPHRPEMGQASATDIARRVPRNTIVHAAHLGTMLLGGTWVAPLWDSPIVIGLVLLLGVGMYRAMVTWQHAFLAWYLLAYLGLYALWPFDEGQRFMVPVAPLAFAMLMHGAVTSWRWCAAWPRRASRIAAAVAVVALAIGVGEWRGIQAKASVAAWTVAGTIMLALLWRHRHERTWSIATRPWPRLRRYRAALLMPIMALGLSRSATAARENLSPDPSELRHAPSVDAAGWLQSAPPGTVMAGQFALLHRLTGRRVVAFPVTTDAQLIAAVLERHDVRYLVVADRVAFEYFEPDEEMRLASLQRAIPRRLVEVHRGTGYRIFQLLR